MAAKKTVGDAKEVPEDKPTNHAGAAIVVEVVTRYRDLMIDRLLEIGDVHQMEETRAKYLVTRNLVKIKK